MEPNPELENDSRRWQTVFSRLSNDDMPRHYNPLTTCDIINPYSVFKNFGIGVGWVDIDSRAKQNRPSDAAEIQYQPAWSKQNLLAPAPKLLTLYAPPVAWAAEETDAADGGSMHAPVAKTVELLNPACALQQLAQMLVVLSGPGRRLPAKRRSIVESRIRSLLDQLQFRSENLDDASASDIGAFSDYLPLNRVRQLVHATRQCMNVFGGSGTNCVNVCFASGKLLNTVSFRRFDNNSLNADADAKVEPDFEPYADDVNCHQLIYELCTSKSNDFRHLPSVVIARHAQSFTVLIEDLLKQKFRVTGNQTPCGTNDVLTQILINPRAASEIACLSQEKLTFFNLEHGNSRYTGRKKATVEMDSEFAWQNITDQEEEALGRKVAYYGSHLTEFCLSDSLCVVCYDTRSMNSSSFLGNENHFSGSSLTQTVVDFTNSRFLYNDATFGVENIDHAFLFAPQQHCIVSNQRIMLFDIRQTATPMLQWPNALNDADLRGEIPNTKRIPVNNIYTAPSIRYADARKLPDTDETLLLLGDYDSCQLLRVRANVGTCMPATAVGFPVRIFSRRLASRHVDVAGVNGDRVSIHPYRSRTTRNNDDDNSEDDDEGRRASISIALPVDDMLDAQPIIGAVMVTNNNNSHTTPSTSAHNDDDDTLADRVGVLLINSVGRVYLRKFKSFYSEAVLPTRPTNDDDE